MTSSKDLQVLQYHNKLTGKRWLGEWHPFDGRRAGEHRSEKGSKIRVVCRWRLKLKPVRHVRVFPDEIAVNPSSSIPGQEQVWIKIRQTLRREGFDFTFFDPETLRGSASSPIWGIAGKKFIDFYQVI